RFAERRPVRHALLPRRVDDPGGDWRFAHHPVRGAEPRTAPGAAFVADVFRAVHRRRIVLLDPPAGGENPSRAIRDLSAALAADPAAVWCDVLLAVEGPRPPRVAGPADVARPTMPDDTLDDSLRVDQRAKRTVGRLARGDVPRAHRRNCRFRKVSASFRRAPI